MNSVDAIDLMLEVLPRRARTMLSIAVAVIGILAPEVVVAGVTWYATQRSDEIVRSFERSGLLPPPATDVPTPAPPR